MRNAAIDNFEEIALDAQALRTLNECIRARASETPTKKSIYGAAFELYAADADEIENLIFTANKLLAEVENLCQAAIEAAGEAKQ